MPPRKKKPEPEAEALPGGVTLPRPKSKRGRPVYKYNPQYAVVAKAMLNKGATLSELAAAFGISDRTIWKWRAMYQEFDDAFGELGHEFDARIERTLAERAMGYSYQAVKIFQNKGIPVIIPYTEHVPPDVGAIKHWLAVRRPDKWRVKEEVEVSGDDAFRTLLQTMAGKKKADE